MSSKSVGIKAKIMLLGTDLAEGKSLEYEIGISANNYRTLLRAWVGHVLQPIYALQLPFARYICSRNVKLDAFVAATNERYDQGRQ